MKKTILCCGSRDFENEGIIRTELESIWASALVAELEFQIIHGAAPGADTMAGEIAAELGFEVKAYPADWSQGRGAGTARNQKMLQHEPICYALAFLTKPLHESRGTADMVRRLKRALVPVRVVGYQVFHVGNRPDFL